MLTTAISQRSSTFSGNVMRLASGTAISQTIGLLAMPILTIFFPPEAFGEAAAYLSLVTIIGIIASLRYEQALLLPENEKEATHLLWICLLSTLLISGIAAIVVGLYGKKVLSGLYLEELEPYLWLLPLSIAAHGTLQTLNFWNTRKREYTNQSIAQISGSIGNNGARLSAGYLGGVNASSLIFAYFGGQILSILVMGLNAFRKTPELFQSIPSGGEIISGIIKYQKFPLVSTWASLLNTASWQLPVLMLSAFFSTTVVGFYALSLRILQVPMHLLGQAISRVFIQQAALVRHDNALSELVYNLNRRLVQLTLLPALTLTVLGDDLFQLIFGPEWNEAGVYTQILSVWALFWFASSPLASLFSVLEKQEIALWINILLFLTRITSLGVGGYYDSPRLAILLFSITGITVYFYLYLLIGRLAGCNLIKFLQPFLICTAYSFLPLLSVYIVKAYISNPIYSVVLAVVINIIFTTVHVWSWYRESK